MARAVVRCLINNIVSPKSSSSTHLSRSLRFSDYSLWQSRYHSNPNESLTEAKKQRKCGEWLTLPPFTTTVNGSALGKELSGRRSEVKCGGAANSTTTTTTALKWVLQCCPDLPRNLVQKLFRLRQVLYPFPL